jgi:3-hydroxybutyrate dehydrogenase
VAIADINAEAAQGAADRLRQEGFEAMGLSCDVTQEQQFVNAIDSVVEAYGTMDILVNNAGLQHVSPIEDFPVDKFEFMLKVMLTGAFIGIKHAFPIMKRQSYGRIINMASVNGVIGFAGKAAYNSAKHGLIGLTKVAALEGAAHGITVNALCPGYVDTPLVRGQLEDLAKTRGVPLESVLEEVIYPLVPQKRLLSVDEIAEFAIS